VSAVPPAGAEGEVSAKLVMQLRSSTGLPMMKCKEALEANGGDFEKAVDWLRKKGLETAARKADRVMKEGRVAIRVSPDAKTAAMVEVDCETEPTKENAEFRALVDGLADLVFSKAAGRHGEVPVAEANAWPRGKGETVETSVKHLVAKIGENMAFRRAAAFSGAARVGSYLHHNAKVGVLVELAGDAKAVSSEAATTLLDGLGKHVAFAKPVGVRREDVPKELADKEMEIYREQAKADPKMSGKPPQVVEKILAGKLDKYFAERCLQDQPWAGPPVFGGAETVKAAFEAASKAAGGPLSVTRFAVFQVGAA
jgi:elongation factor Ts